LQKKLEAETGAAEETPQEKIQNTFSNIRNLGFMNTLYAIKSKLAGIGPNEAPAAGSMERMQTNANKLLSLSDNSFVAKAKDFLLMSTYGIRNWMWLVGIIIVLAVISYFLKSGESEGEGKKKGVWGRFMDWLEEEDEVEKPVVESEQKGPKANDILKEVEREQREKKKPAAPKKKPKVKRY